jgi:hypothetical protein
VIRPYQSDANSSNNVISKEFYVESIATAAPSETNTSSATSSNDTPSSTQPNSSPQGQTTINVQPGRTSPENNALEQNKVNTSPTATQRESKASEPSSLSRPDQVPPASATPTNFLGDILDFIKSLIGIG